jgi:hypothetical protein
MQEDPAAPVMLWQCLNELAAAQPGVLKMVVVFMGSYGAARLRGVNRAMRKAVNRTVTTVAYYQHTADSTCDLATRFPDANCLKVVHVRPCTTIVEGLQDETYFLRHIVEVSPALLAMIQHLDLQLHGAPANQRLVDSLVEFLSRCVGWHYAPGLQAALIRSA